MALARRLALAMSGDLVVKAPPGQGCEFRLQTAAAHRQHLGSHPRARRPGARRRTCLTTGAPGMMRGHVLLVEDAPDHQRLVGRLLAALVSR